MLINFPNLFQLLALCNEALGFELACYYEDGYDKYQRSLVDGPLHLAKANVLTAQLIHICATEGLVFETIQDDPEVDRWLTIMITNNKENS